MTTDTQAIRERAERLKQQAIDALPEYEEGYGAVGVMACNPADVLEIFQERDAALDREKVLETVYEQYRADFPASAPKGEK